jgi:hypothetical protein
MQTTPPRLSRVTTECPGAPARKRPVEQLINLTADFYTEYLRLRLAESPRWPQAFLTWIRAEDILLKTDVPEMLSGPSHHDNTATAAHNGQGHQ